MYNAINQIPDIIWLSSVFPLILFSTPGFNPGYHTAFCYHIFSVSSKVWQFF